MPHRDLYLAATQAGLDPLLGFYHRPAFGRESLASDLIEPLRPSLDQWLWQLLRTQTLRPEHFSQDKGACVLGKAGRQQFYQAWETAFPPWQRWLRQQCRQLAQVLARDGEPWLESLSDEDGESW